MPQSKSMFLFFDTKNIARILKKTIKDGFVEIEGKLFMVDEANPILVKSGTGYKPLYIVKWSNVTPSTSINKPLVGEKPEFDDKLSKDMTPEMLRKLTGLKILGNMIKTKAKTEMGGIMWMMIGLVAGIGILWSLIAFGIIKF